MKSRVLILALLVAPSLWADTLTLTDGSILNGTFQGFSAQQFLLKDEDGDIVRTFAADIQSLVLDNPVRVTARTVTRQYEGITFSRVDHYTVRWRKDGAPASDPVYMLKRMEVVGPVAPAPAPAPPAESVPAVDQAGVTRVVAPSKTAPVRDWKRAGKWREVDDDRSIIISHGEAVDVESALRKGVVNVVHFHYPSAMASVRQGSYVQGIMMRHPGRMVVLKVVAQDFNAPICDALKLKSLPQFWFYGSDGRLVKKLVDRFTESDIDAALREAGRN